MIEPIIRDNMKFYNADNMEVMKIFKDKEFDLAIVDPPYGININPNMGLKKGQKKRHNKINWDNNTPPPEYFEELFRISKNQIIWGGNYFALPPTKHFIFWDKMNPDGLSFSDGEMAWTSYNKAIRKWSKRNVIDGKIHPTQKPIELYEWILNKYANKNDKIIDTHLGSNSIGIAIAKANRLDKMNLTFTGIEMDVDYFNAGIKRLDEYCRQKTLF